MTEPLTPPNCDLSDFAFMPLDVARLRDSELASNETPEACWAAVLLWAASWHQIPAASVPNDDKWLAKQAGYAARGKIDKAWPDVRAGALRGWIECSDGRLYHPVVAEKACEAWKAKLDQRWRTECGRIKKHNDRHHTSIEKPTFADWLAAGCPVGQPLFVPRDTPPCPGDVPEETHSKGQGEGQGQGDSKEKDTHTAGTALPENFALPKGWGEWAIAEFPHWTPETVRSIAAQFADHQRSKGATSLDWQATWRKWCRDDLTQRAHPAPKAKPAAVAPVAESKTVPMSPAAIEAQREREAEQARRAQEIQAMTPEQRAEQTRVARELSARMKAAA